jgi:hypothetical protein
MNGKTPEQIPATIISMMGFPFRKRIGAEYAVQREKNTRKMGIKKGLNNARVTNPRLDNNPIIIRDVLGER